MCGIAGWVDFERDLTRERAAVMAYDVTVVSDRTPDGIAAGKVMSSQCMTSSDSAESP